MPGSPAPYLVKRLDPGAPDFAALVEESRKEGFWMLVRLADGWAGERNRFSRPGETLVAAFGDGGLAGVCGLNVDPYVAARREGRVRHLYVRAAERRRGVGRLLVEAIADKAARHFPVLNVRAPAEAFPFYEALGFTRFESEWATHRRQLAPARTGRAE